jgi:hypothetical protein
MNKLYFAHSKRLFGTKLENEILQVLRKFFPCTAWLIIDPSQLKFPPNEDPLLYFLLVVKMCQAVVFVEYKDHVSRGVYREIEEALKNKISVYVIRKICDNYRLFRFKKMKIKHHLDFGIQYGEVIKVEDL